MKNIDKLIDKFLMSDTLSGNLYHYTNSYDNLIKILKCQRLIMTDYTCLQHEIYHALGYLKNRIKDFDLKFKVNVGNKVASSFWESFELYRKELRIFITAFSVGRDDRNLWRAFGAKGAGFAIGFSKDHFIPESMTEWLNVKLKMHYGEESLDMLYEEIIKILIYLENVKSEKEYKDILFVKLFSRLIPELPRFLVSRFEKQREFRLYAMDLSITPERRIPEKLIFEQEGILRMYCEKISAQHIIEVLIGYRNNFHEYEKKIRQDLKGYFPEIHLNNLKITASEAYNM